MNDSQFQTNGPDKDPARPDDPSPSRNGAGGPDRDRPRALQSDSVAFDNVKLRRLIRAAGGEKVIAERTGIPWRTVYRHVSGETSRPLGDTAVKYARALGVDVEALYKMDTIEPVDKDRP